MAIQEQVERLKDSVDLWNQWRKQHPYEPIDLEEADLVRANLTDANLWRARLKGAKLSGAVVRNANLYGAWLEGADLSGADLTFSDLTGATLWQADLSGAMLLGTDLRRADLREAILKGAMLMGTKFYGASLEGANLEKAKLNPADLGRAFLPKANLAGADLTHAILEGAILIEANLTGANLTQADLRSANLWHADLTGAVLTGADLTGSNLVRATLTKADLAGCQVYGVAAWDLELGGANQKGLVITPKQDARITVDDVEVAQFLYLLLTNRKIRNVIHTITSKAVLILGRFSDTRKPLLDALHATLRDRHGLVPILFDWEPAQSRDLTETVLLMASMCRFVIADVTDAKSIPQELSHIVPNLPSVPVQPIILASEYEYGMFEHWRAFSSVLPEYRYESPRQLLDELQDAVLSPIEEWEHATDKGAAKERQMRDQIAEQTAEIARLKQQLKLDAEVNRTS